MQNIVLGILLLNVSLSFGQTDSAISRSGYFSLTYFGEKVFHPGLQVALHRSLALSKKSTNFRTRLDIGVSMAGYVHPKNHHPPKAPLCRRY
ncbi:MAG: hypothetical protein HC880_10555 [Bacteroidia bacterium]|nr:hypothetical protein [Bacteroidia bacterium]